jgi:hypothetical protein
MVKHQRLLGFLEARSNGELRRRGLRLRRHAWFGKNECDGDGAPAGEAEIFSASGHVTDRAS